MCSSGSFTTNMEKTKWGLKLMWLLSPILGWVLAWKILELFQTVKKILGDSDQIYWLFRTKVPPSHECWQCLHLVSDLTTTTTTAKTHPKLNLCWGHQWEKLPWRARLGGLQLISNKLAITTQWLFMINFINWYSLLKPFFTNQCFLDLWK